MGVVTMWLPLTRLAHLPGLTLSSPGPAAFAACAAASTAHALARRSALRPQVETRDRFAAAGRCRLLLGPARFGEEGPTQTQHEENRAEPAPKPLILLHGVHLSEDEHGIPGRPADPAEKRSTFPLHGRRGKSRN